MNQFKNEDVLFEDSDLLVCRKHAGMAVQSARSSQMDLECALKNYLVRDQKGVPYLRVIHRLDQPVEGILIFAKSADAARILSKDIVQRRIEKYYLAMVCTDQAPAKGVLENYLIRNSKNNASRVVPRKTDGCKRALLAYKLLKQYEHTALLEIQLHTGRHHQIRVQTAHAGMPLVGDCKYNPNEPIRANVQLALCAHKLRFWHPGQDKELEFEIEPENEIFQEGAGVR